eukprot:TRINITY_DN11396_c0_g1_i1.p1 TRINITY_DN11396_c0_g1~~TRINITY_DN11396_c0_g1_i1.p1  ORF type:complete len:411 (+),score=58.42 TRINITY_DN11396_c0_g1_i1:41-1273(+)
MRLRIGKLLSFSRAIRSLWMSHVSPQKLAFAPTPATLPGPPLAPTPMNLPLEIASQITPPDAVFPPLTHTVAFHLNPTRPSGLFDEALLVEPAVIPSPPPAVPTSAGVATAAPTAVATTGVSTGMAVDEQGGAVNAAPAFPVLTKVPASPHRMIPQVLPVEGAGIFVRYIKNFLSVAEATHLVRLGAPRLAPSMMRHGDGTILADDRRTSTSGIIAKSEDPVVQAIETRACGIVGFPSTHSEPLQILRYRPGQRYDAHFDSYDDLTPEGAAFKQQGYQRVATVFVFLSDTPPCDCKPLPGTLDSRGVPRAGMFEQPLCAATHFPSMKTSFAGRCGDAVMWANTDANRDTLPLALHQGTRLCSGEKWGLNIWIHAREMLSMYGKEASAPKEGPPPSLEEAKRSGGWASAAR